MPNLIKNLIIKINFGPDDLFVCEWAAHTHAEFEKIHPFSDGNGRTGRLLMNYILIANGYPPAIILKSQRPKYLLPKLSGREDLIPFSTLAEGTKYQSSYLRRLAQEGKLQAVKDGNLWLSSKKHFQEYIDSRSPRGRR